MLSTLTRLVELGPLFFRLSAGQAASPEVIQQLAELRAAQAEAAQATNNAWLMTASALVLFMTLPGLSLFYGGLVRRKNVLSVMMQCIFLAGIMTIVWALWGYSLAFGGSNPWFGNGEFLLLNNVTMVAGSAPTEGGIPRLTHMVFQGMFFIITPALICGAFAERFKFSAMVLFSVLWGTLIYAPLCHWVWDGGILAFGGEASILGGALDFAGGTVVHISSGVSALACALLVGTRQGFGKKDMRPHNLTYTVMGAGMLWVGWFGFNAGSALDSSGLAANAFVVTHLSAAAGAVSWSGAEWWIRKKPSVLGAASGAVAGLVCITPASGFVQPMPAIAFGLLAGPICFFACSRVKKRLGYDDSLDAFGVHGVGGILGALLTGVFATKNVFAAGADGLFYAASGWQLLLGQTAAVIITIVFSLAGSLFLLKVIDMAVGLRVDGDDEQRGLDLAEHGEQGYVL